MAIERSEPERDGPLQRRLAPSPPAPSGGRRQRAYDRPMAYELRAFMLTDLEASTELWDLDPARMSAALELHDELIERVVEKAGGSLIRSKGEGDSTFSVFVDPADAVEAARTV